MAVVGGLLIFIGLAGMGVAAWALVKGGLGWANIANRKVAGGVLAGAFVVFMVGGGISPKDEDKTVQAGTADETTTTTAGPTSTTEPTTTTTTAAASTATSPPVTTATTRATTTTTKPPTTTTTTAKPAATTTTTVKPATTSTTATTSPPVQPPTGQLAFRTMQCDAPGSPDDASNTNDEWVELVNNGAAVDLTGWTLHDEGPNYTYTFSGLTLAPGDGIKVHTGSGADTATDLYWGRNQHVWNNTGTEIAYLVNPSGTLVASKNCR